jgi:ribonucleoside-diphosphate reductase alpha chain
VSKTCNVPPTMGWEEFKNVYMQAWQGGAKGCTTFNTGGKRSGILTEEQDGLTCEIDPESGRRSCE